MAVNLISWNINNFSAKKGLSEFYNYVAGTTDWWDAQFIGLIEVVSFLGDSFGDEIGGRINYGDSVRYQDSDQYVGHSEQYLALWNKNSFNHTDTQDNFTGIEFPNSSERAPCIYVMDVAVSPSKIYKGIPVGLFHAPGPSKGAIVTSGCNNLSQIPIVKSAAQGIIMGDFNINPSTVASAPGLTAFGNLGKLGFNMQLIAQKTSLKQKSSVTSSSSFLDCLSAEYDNFFVKMPSGVTITSRVMDLISPAVIGNPSYNKNYANLLGLWDAKKNGATSGTICSYKTIKDAFDAYRSCVSDHLPIFLTLS